MASKIGSPPYFGTDDEVSLIEIVHWTVSEVKNPSGSPVAFSDGLPLNAVRDIKNGSNRLIVNDHGFIDITILKGPYGIQFNLNKVYITVGTWSSIGDTVFISISISDATFSASITKYSVRHRFKHSSRIPIKGTNFGASITKNSVSDRYKPLPQISADDVAFLVDMIAKKYVPYQNIPDAKGKTDEEIRALGKQYFPFTPHNYELAMSMYDWTTASFSRSVFFKVFQYTSLPHPYPLNNSDLANMIWESNWGTYNPHDKDFMNSFMMVPADTEADVRAQVDTLALQLQKFSDIENRLLAAAIEAMPRTDIFSTPMLYSGQVDIYQMGTSRFGIEFLESPINSGPIKEEMVYPLEEAISSFASPHSHITTKMVWSFTDSVNDAMHYQNGILLMCGMPSSNDYVWDIPAYTTPLSDGPDKIEWTFPPNTKFLVTNAYTATISQKTVQVIVLEPQGLATAEDATETFNSEAKKIEIAPRNPAEDWQKLEQAAAAYDPHYELETRKKAEELKRNWKLPIGEGDRRKLIHKSFSHSTGGRRCKCYDVAEEIFQTTE